MVENLSQTPLLEQVTPPNFVGNEAVEIYYEGDFLKLDIRGSVMRFSYASIPTPPRVIGNVGYALQSIDKYSKVLGYEQTAELVNESTSIWHVSLPTVDNLNAIRIERLVDFDTNLFPFVWYVGGRLTNEEYLSYIAAGQIPIATNIEYLQHDYAHAVGFSIIGKELMDLLSSLSMRALLSKNNHVIEDTATGIDKLSGCLALGRELSELPYGIVLGYQKLFKASRLLKRQNELLKSIQTLAYNFE